MKIVRAVYEILNNKISSLIVRTFHKVNCQNGVIFKKVPHINVHASAKVKIGKNTTINSSNYGYHINMFSKCKLYADRENAMIEIGSNCRIHGTCIHAFKRIKIGDNCLIAANTQIIDGNGHQLCMDNPQDRLILSDEGRDIIIEDNVWIASNCTILGGTIIGEGSIITAGSVVKGTIPAKSIYGGNPAKLIKQY